MRFSREVTAGISHGREPVVCKSQTKSPKGTTGASFHVVACRPFRTEDECRIEVDPNYWTTGERFLERVQTRFERLGR